MSDESALFRSARWICDPAFVDLAPRALLRKQHAPDLAPPHRDDLGNRHCLVRGTVELATVPSRARLLISADDCYRLWINGAFVGIGPAPGYPQRSFCNAWEVAHLLRPGRNVIAVQVYYQGLVNRVWVSGDHRQGLIAELSAGDEVLAASGCAWRYSISRAWSSAGLVGYQTQVLERFDSRAHERAWRETGFDDDSWTPVSERGDHGYRFVLQPTPPLAVYGLAPSAIEELPGGGLLLDFGHEVVGNLTLRARGRAGDEIELRFGEELLPDRRVRHVMRCYCDYREAWILSRRDDDELDQFDYKGFRYAEILPPPGVAVDRGSIRAMLRHYPLDDARCSWESLPRLDAIVATCVRTLCYGAQDALLDCPTREKGQYLGDISVSGHAHLLVSGDLAYARKSLADFAASAAICPGLMAVANCGFMQEIGDFSPQWATQLRLYHQHSGDLEFVRAMAPVLDGLMAHYLRYGRGDGLISDVTDKWNLVDWPANLRDGYDFPLADPTPPGIHAAINAHWIAAVRDANALRALLGGAPFADEAALGEAFRAVFYRPHQGLFADAPASDHCSLHSNALALYAGVAPPQAVPRIVELIARKRLSCGVYMAYFVLKALASVGEHDLVWRLLMDEGEHSWTNMLREGATTCFEAWGKDQKWNTSLCHPWACAPIPVLIEDIVGLRPHAPGWRAIAFAPHFPQELDHLRLKLRVATGEVLVEHGGGRTTITAPAGVDVIRS